MRKINLFVSLMVSFTLLLGGCNVSNTAKGTAIGGGGGAAVGAGIGALLGGGKGATWGAGIGAIVGGAAGALIGNKMDKQKKELEKIKDAQVESVNDGQAIKVTFDSGILFATNSSTLNQASKNSLTQFANTLKSHPDTDVHIYGHTDSTGSDKINIPLSNERAGSVEKFLLGQGISSARMTFEGLGSSQPVADNGTVTGRQQNRRVEVYIVPNQKMIQEAQSGTLK
ncbi:MAG: OmpA family protein [Dysgonamonadaceae bacterium]|jgi:outer membrane protein OmpA-like peptidoglycan-associated protein|nr:OmpA family protein [Dysgonamonadaceae bacterium]